MNPIYILTYFLLQRNLHNCVSTLMQNPESHYGGEVWIPRYTICTYIYAIMHATRAPLIPKYADAKLRILPQYLKA